MRFRPLGNVPMFEAEWYCTCGSVIGLKIAEAIAASQTGAYHRCHICGQRWIVTTANATPIGKEETNADEPQTPYYVEDISNDPGMALLDRESFGRIPSD